MSTLDHVIVAGNDPTSFAERGLISAWVQPLFAPIKGGEGRGPTECVDAQAIEVTCAPLKHRPVFPAITGHTHESVLNGSLAKTGFIYR